MITDLCKYKIVVHGKVQGVFFRDNVHKRANELELVGWVRNKMDGTVEIVAEGTQFALGKLVQFCKEGPQGAQVTRVDVDKFHPTNEFSVFKIRY